MRKFLNLIILSAVFFIGQGSVWAQSKPVTGPKTISRFSPVPSPPKSPNLHAVNQHLREKMLQIPKWMKAGKMTKLEARSAWAQIKIVREKEVGFTARNKMAEITPGQKAELDNLLTGINPSR